MILVGSNLKKIRLSKKINLINICNDLKISRTLLKQIENDDFQKGISIVYLIGHIRVLVDLYQFQCSQVKAILEWKLTTIIQRQCIGMILNHLKS